MNELEFCIVALTMLVLCNLMLIGWLNRRIKRLDNFVQWDHQNSIDGILGRLDANMEITRKILGRLDANEHHLDNIDELFREMLPDHERLVRHYNHTTIKNAEWFDIDGEGNAIYIKPIDAYKSKKFLKIPREHLK